MKTLNEEQTKIWNEIVELTKKMFINEKEVTITLESIEAFLEGKLEYDELSPEIKVIFKELEEKHPEYKGE